MANKVKVEGVHRISAFLKSTQLLDWENMSENAWNELFNQCTTLISHEIEYYYNSRKSSRAWSVFFRSGALAFGTLGFLAPLAESAGYKGVAVYGYLLFAVSAAFFTANSVFGGTSGHSRYVLTQLRLEKLLALMVVEWQTYRDQGEKHEDRQSRTEFLIERMTEAYEIILEETNAWGEAAAEALRDYENKVNKGAGAGAS